jgi:hypothetical protein
LGDWPACAQTAPGDVAAMITPESGYLMIKIKVNFERAVMPEGPKSVSLMCPIMVSFLFKI